MNAIIKLNRRSWLRVLALGATTSWSQHSLANPPSQDDQALKELARKVVNKVEPNLAQACLVSVKAQLQNSPCESPLDTIAPILHADDIAHERIVEVEGLLFSHTQIGLLNLLNQTGAP